ncbi:IS30 family transposase [Candidatus Poriferisodalis sp.]|uniref:IS30 family transposase n=1 Tax=Candidatus Poriferisodalis sp. TaxID=3101277 RepID=UPI003D0B563E
MGPRPHRRQSEPHRRGHARGAHQPLRGHRSAARRLRRAAAVTAALGRQPGGLVRSLTWDQGREMARWADVEAALGIEVFFCEPRSPWQRPTNEHTNALLRRWLPKGTSLDIAQLRLSVIEDNLNHMPRRLHHWASAHDIYTRLRRNHR